MDYSGYQGVIADAVVLIFGLAVSTAYFIFIALNKKYSFRGWKGVVFFLCAAIFALLLSLAIANFSWDVLLIHSLWGNVAISVFVVYPLAFLLLRKIFLITDNVLTASMNRALLIMAVLIIAVLSVWYLAER